MVSIQPPPKNNCFRLREKLFVLLQENGYSFNSINLYRKLFDLFEDFACKNNIEKYDQTVGENFLKSCKKYRGKFVNGKRITTDAALTFIKTLNNIILYGQLKAPKKEVDFYCPPCFLSIKKDYLAFLTKKGYQSITIESHNRYISSFLNDIAQESKSLDNVLISNLYLILEKYAFKSNAIYCISAFLRFAYESSNTTSDLSKIIIFPRRETKTPTVYSKDEMQKVLRSIDRNSDIGKRNYAMILIAYRLGLRATDIISLKFENIDFQNKKINIIQQKTGVPLSLPLLPEIEEALFGYLEVRPNISENKIFLSIKAPFLPIKRTTGNSQFKKLLDIAQINTAERKCGFHALRSTLATELVSENISYPVTQKILGHTNSSSIKRYVKLDIENLRNCALSVPLPSGNFKRLLDYSEDISNE